MDMNLLIRSLHLRTSLRTAELSDAPVKQVNLIIEIHAIDREPLVLVLALGKLDRLPQAPRPERRLGELLELPVRGALARLLRSEGRARARVTVKEVRVRHDCSPLMITVWFGAAVVVLVVVVGGWWVAKCCCVGYGLVGGRDAW